MKKFLVIAVLVAGLIALFGRGSPGTGNGGAQLASDQMLADAYANHSEHLQVQGGGHVIAVLPDDREGSRHQRFILRLDSGQTLLIAHNIDLASRIDALAEGELITFSGEYVWNENGGVVHWTHRDPERRHPDGWLQRGGQLYQ
ncbi:DUF3465 domain-containing protein [Solimonas terrae]|uniref:DUF3465 domain-containing protein n=1 Tax=Solimonas terrae TaxID=1396819 RepID=A0A6M2BXJ9_9GAMM|nr:DUF3465 domain-containing protein [Solimonas terrae]NGY06567.1 DUF3465 domain-containing protein [Solimonas terrae]